MLTSAHQKQYAKYQPPPTQMELSQHDDSNKHSPSSAAQPSRSTPTSNTSRTSNRSNTPSLPSTSGTIPTSNTSASDLHSTTPPPSSAPSEFTSETLIDAFGECLDNLKEIRYKALLDFQTLLKTKRIQLEELDEIVVFLCQIAVYENTEEYKTFSCPRLLKKGKNLNYLAYNSLLVMLKYQCNNNEKRKEIVTCILHVILFSFGSNSREQTGFRRPLHGNLMVFVNEIMTGLETSKWMLQLFVIFSESYCDSKVKLISKFK